MTSVTDGPPAGPESAPGSGNLRHRIYEDLRNKLRRGEISAEDRLVDVEIARSAGVSRMPVREALLQLIIEGHLVGTTRGFALPTLDESDIVDIFEVRKLIEPRAAANAARDLDDAGLEILRRAEADARQAASAGDAEALGLANTLFRQTWIAALRNRRLADTILRFADQAQIVRRGTLADPKTQKVVIDGLALLLDAFVRRDSLAAHDRMAAFMYEAEKSYFRDTANDAEKRQSDTEERRQRR
ncbi:GntR family transcriptional regulator [Microbaculum marinisediminis]|uniref:GntR family transcriptional regulator n=1 Tax=Microbaculum marinisediminis TaxID=2931392 RepID=A0AAW5R5C6_9HYPH|nr:GntR family transcriptional regulator [Microbaculum sp. A6E488]MCT8973730.1 GntR family transcriptional regulator [Microbaculum sp. A6E488]